MAVCSFPSRLVRRLDNRQFPLNALEAVREARAYLDDLEEELLTGAVGMGAATQDIADALGMSRQGAYLKIKALSDSRSSPPAGADDSSPPSQDARP